MPHTHMSVGASSDGTHLSGSAAVQAAAPSAHASAILWRPQHLHCPLDDSHAYMQAPAPAAAPAAAATATAPPAPAAAAPTAPPPSAPAATPVKRSDGRVIATPYAKKLAQQLKVDLASLAGSGPAGRITASDVEAAGNGGEAPAL